MPLFYFSREFGNDCQSLKAVQNEETAPEILSTQLYTSKSVLVRMVQTGGCRFPFEGVGVSMETLSLHLMLKSEVSKIEWQGNLCSSEKDKELSKVPPVASCLQCQPGRTETLLLTNTMQR